MTVVVDRAVVRGICNCICIAGWLYVHASNRFPGPRWVASYWCLVFLSNSLMWSEYRGTLLTVPTSLLFLGCASNAAAMAFNGGWMPVMGSKLNALGVWRAATVDDRMLWLCDRFWGFSIGDFTIFTAATLHAVLAIKMARNKKQTELQEKFGI